MGAPRVLLVSTSMFIGCSIHIPSLDSLILRPASEVGTTPADLGFGFETIEIELGEHRRVSLWYVFADEAKALVVIVPGSDANKARYLEALPAFIPAGYDVILFDYEGYGESPGDPSLRNLVENAFAVATYAKSLHENVVLFGVSIGTPVAARVAAEMEFSACMFEGSLILLEEVELWLQNRGLEWSLLSAAANLYVHLQTPEDYDILHHIQLVDEPKLFLHSVDDEVVPYAGGIKVFEAAPEPKTFQTLRGSHGEMIRLDPVTYSQTLTEWLDRQLADAR